MEILFEAREGHTLPASLLRQATQVGARYRIEVPEGELYAALEQLRESDAKILSVSPVRPTLEDYFVGLVGRERAQSHAVEVMTR